MSNGKVIKENGSVVWYKDDKLHREDGPAVERIDGYKAWYLDNMMHRLDGPAIEYVNGGREWWLNGLRHRIDGPAVAAANGYKVWYQNGMLHRLDGPAIIDADDRCWYQNGEYHREDGPAVEMGDGFKAWYRHGILHRTDGPAIEDHSGEKYWYIDGVPLPEKECKSQTSSKKESNVPSTKQQMFKIYAENNLQHLLDENGVQLNETGTHYKNSKLNEQYLNFCKTVDMVLDHTKSLKRKRIFVIASKLKEKTEDFNRYQFSEKPSTHLTYKKAFTEAQRLGIKFPDRKFYIFQRIMKVV
jgi:hypothetical protein